MNERRGGYVGERENVKANKEKAAVTKERGKKMPHPEEAVTVVDQQSRVEIAPRSKTRRGFEDEIPTVVDAVVETTTEAVDGVVSGTTEVVESSRRQRADVPLVQKQEVPVPPVVRQPERMPSRDAVAEVVEEEETGEPTVLRADTAPLEAVEPDEVDVRDTSGDVQPPTETRSSEEENKWGEVWNDEWDGVENVSGLDPQNPDDAGMLQVYARAAEQRREAYDADAQPRAALNQQYDAFFERQQTEARRMMEQAKEKGWSKEGFERAWEKAEEAWLESLVEMDFDYFQAQKRVAEAQDRGHYMIDNSQEVAGVDRPELVMPKRELERVLRDRFAARSIGTEVANATIERLKQQDRNEQAIIDKRFAVAEAQLRRLDADDPVTKQKKEKLRHEWDKALLMQRIKSDVRWQQEYNPSATYPFIDRAELLSGQTAEDLKSKKVTARVGRMANRGVYGVNRFVDRLLGKKTARERLDELTSGDEGDEWPTDSEDFPDVQLLPTRQPSRSRGWLRRPRPVRGAINALNWFAGGVAKSRILNPGRKSARERLRELTSGDEEDDTWYGSSEERW